MAITADRRQVWMDLPEVLPFGTRYAPAPLPPSLPRSGTPAFWAAPIGLRDIVNRIEDEMFDEIAAMLIETALSGRGC